MIGPPRNRNRIKQSLQCSDTELWPGCRSDVHSSTAIGNTLLRICMHVCTRMSCTRHTLYVGSILVKRQLGTLLLSIIARSLSGDDLGGMYRGSCWRHFVWGGGGTSICM